MGLFQIKHFAGEGLVGVNANLSGDLHGLLGDGLGA